MIGNSWSSTTSDNPKLLKKTFSLFFYIFFFLLQRNEINFFSFLNYGPIRPLKIINYTSSECSGTASVCSLKHFQALSKLLQCFAFTRKTWRLLSSFSVFGVFMIIWIYQNSISLCSHSFVQTFAKKIYNDNKGTLVDYSRVSNAFERLKCWI